MISMRIGREERPGFQEMFHINGDRRGLRLRAGLADKYVRSLGRWPALAFSSLKAHSVKQWVDVGDAGQRIPAIFDSGIA